MKKTGRERLAKNRRGPDGEVVHRLKGTPQTPLVKGVFMGGSCRGGYGPMATGGRGRSCVPEGVSGDGGAVELA